MRSFYICQGTQPPKRRPRPPTATARFSPYPHYERKQPDWLPPTEQPPVWQGPAAAADALRRESVQRRSELLAGLPAALDAVGCAAHSLLCPDDENGTTHSASVFSWEPRQGAVWDHSESLRAACAVLPLDSVIASGRSHLHLHVDDLLSSNNGRSLLREII